MKIDPEALRHLPERLCRSLKVVPFHIVRNTGSGPNFTVTVAGADPGSLERLRQETARRSRWLGISPLLVPPEVVETALRMASWPSTGYDDFRTRLPRADLVTSGARPQFSALGANDVPIVRCANLILSQAVSDDAWEIQLIPGPKATEVYYRIDGVCQSVMSPPRHVHHALAGRLRVLAGVSLGATRGEVRHKHGEKDIRFQAHFLPTTHGELCVLHRRRRAELEYPESFRRALEQPTGLVLVEAPEGHGLRHTFGAVQTMLSARRPWSLSTWCSAWCAQPTLWAPIGQEAVLKKLSGASPSAVILEEVTDGVAALGELSKQALVVAGVRPAGSVAHPTLGVLRQRIVRQRCRHCRGEGCDHCKMVGHHGWSLVCHWSHDPGGLSDLIDTMLRSGETTEREAEEVG